MAVLCNTRINEEVKQCVETVQLMLIILALGVVTGSNQSVTSPFILSRRPIRVTFLYNYNIKNVSCPLPALGMELANELMGGGKRSGG